MTCEECQSLLLQSDEIDAPDGVFERAKLHAAGCAACDDLVRKLRRLDGAVRSLPEPQEMQAARLRFETRFAPKQRQRSWRWAAIAAALILSMGGGTFAYLHHQNQTRLVASSETIDQAVGLNLSLGENDSDAERQKLFAQGSQDLYQKADARLTDDDRQFADSLIGNARFLIDHREPLAQADHFTHMAELLVTRMDSASHKNPRAMNHLSQAYLNVMNQGVHRNLDLAVADLSSPEKQKRLMKLIQRNLALESRLEIMLKDHPDQQQQLHKQLEQVQHRLHRLQLHAATTPAATNPMR